ncbi:MAG: IS630 family transposase [Acidobacteriaceae bacterium]
MGGEALAGNKKNARRGRAWILFQDESGVSERPPVRRTWAPKGETPVLVHAFNRKKLSVCAALGYRWDGERCRLWFQTRPGSYNDESLMAFLRDVKKHLRGQKAILIWDGLPAHKSRKMKQYLEGQRGWLRVEMLPGYSPDLNPVEDLWGNVKGQELASLYRGSGRGRSRHIERHGAGAPIYVAALVPAPCGALFLTLNVTSLCEVQ